MSGGSRVSVGNIELGEELFRTGPSTFYKGVNAMLGNEVLIRRFDIGYSGPDGVEAMRETFFRAQRHAAQLGHPNIFRPMDIIDEGTALWTVHEWHANRPTAYVIERRGAAPVAETAHVAAQIADALAYIHTRDFVHGKVTPGEVVVGADERAFLISLTKSAELAAGIWPLDPGVQGLSPFSSPEELNGEVPTALSDTYSLAACLVYWLSAAWPRGGTSKDEALERARTGAPIVRLDSLRGDVPEQLVDAIDAAMAPDPADRRGSCAALTSLLGEVHRQLVAEVPSGFETGSHLEPHGDASNVQIMGRHGAGAFGIVFRARDEARSSHLAVKALKPEHRANDEARQRFVREAQTLREIDHENVVRVRGIGEHGDTPFVIMDFVEGPSLGTLLLREGVLGALEAARIARGVARGLQAIHEQGIVHRDLKPHNVLVTEGLRAVITDFGVARDRAAPRLTLTGHVVGTPAYMAPEQVAGERVTASADLYALGAILYEMLSGQTPFPMRDTLSTMRAIRETPAPAVPEHVPSPLAAVVERLLAKQPEDRYPDAGFLAAVLDELIEGIEEAGDEGPAPDDLAIDG